MMVDTKYLDGSALYGDDLAPGEIARWYAQEEQGFYRLATEVYKLEASGSYSYEYDALNASSVSALTWCSMPSASRRAVSALTPTARRKRSTMR